MIFREISLLLLSALLFFCSINTSAAHLTVKDINQRFELMHPEKGKRFLKWREPNDHLDAPFLGECWYMDIDGDGVCE